jgi:16S rRNA (cytosine967-C5)-methyltransferase
MAGQTQKDARSVAIAVLNEYKPKKDYASAILNRLLAQTQQKQRATDLVFGTIRNRTAIDMIIASLADRVTKRIPLKLLNILRIGAYELIYCPRTGEHAIVNEAVEYAKKTAGKKQSGFVNAVLRQITRHIQNRQIDLSNANVRRTLPQTACTGCEFDIEILPAPNDSPDDYFSSAFSLPQWLISQWLLEFGLEKTRQICFASNRKPGIYIRPNSIKTTAEDLVEMLSRENIESVIVNDSMIKIKSPAAITELPGFDEGLFTVQDITAAQAIRLLNPQPDWKILDLCAAPGGKTTQLAELTNDKATIIATYIGSERLEMVRQNVNRLALNSITVINYENLSEAVAKIGSFDCILLDVPCSNTGVLAKRLEVRHRITQKAIEKIAQTQSSLLATAASMIKPNGKICYSTCSIQSRENSELIRALLKEHAFELEAEKLILPSAQDNHDGGFAAILKKLSD